MFKKQSESGVLICSPSTWEMPRAAQGQFQLRSEFEASQPWTLVVREQSTKPSPLPRPSLSV